MLKFLLVVTILLSIAVIAVVYTDYDRKIKLWFTPIERYALPERKPGKKALIVSLAQFPPSEMMIKSLLDQSVVPDEIVAETNNADHSFGNAALKKLVAVRRVGSTDIRERNVDNVIVVRVDGVDEILPYDFLENHVNRKST